MKYTINKQKNVTVVTLVNTTEVTKTEVTMSEVTTTVVSVVDCQ